MQITETVAEGLKREFKVTIPSQAIAAQVDKRLGELSRTLRLPGFRPGKVPMTLVKQRYEASVMGEVLDKLLQDSTAKVVADNQLRPAMQPKVEVTKFEAGGDLEYTMALEQLPEVEPMDFSTLELERPTVEVTDAQLDESLQRLAKRQAATQAEAVERAAEAGDIVVIDFKGSVDGAEDERLSSQGQSVEVGSGDFLGGADKELVGAAAGDTRTLTWTLPDTYPEEDKRGKEASFAVTVKEVRAPKAVAIDDELAKSIGAESLEQLKGFIRDSMARDYGRIARTKLKRVLFDKLAAEHGFSVPQTMVDAEFEQIWSRWQQEAKASGEQEKDEETAKAEFRAIAERRVRLGLLLAEVGRRENIQVSRDELTRAVFTEAEKYPGQERMVIEFYRKNPQMVENLRAPLFEDKVVDHIIGKAKVTDRPVSEADLLKGDEEEGALA